MDTAQPEFTTTKNRLRIEELNSDVRVLDEKHDSLRSIVASSLEVQEKTQEQLSSFISKADQHFAQARLVHKLVYGILAFSGMTAAGYFAGKFFDLI